MPITDFFNFRRKSETAKKATDPGKKITAGGQIAAPHSTVITIAPKRFDLDLAQFKMAIRAAENMDYTRRSRLYDMYEDVMLDPHMISIVSKRKNALLGAKIEFQRDGAPDDDINKQLRSPWFMKLVGDIFDAKLYGFTLLQLTMGADGFVECFNVPRKNVDPQLKLIKRYQSDIIGEPFDTYPGLLLVDGEHKLGILASCLPYIIYKNGTVGDWCEFSEIFGMPIRDYEYDAADENARQRTMADAIAQGSGTTFIHQQGTKLSFIESSNKSGSAEVYSKLTQMCNEELSKAILGNTLTTQASDTGTQALGKVHKEEEDGFTAADKRFILEVLNYNMTDIFTMLGINTEGGEFVYAKTKKDALEQAQLFAIARNQLNLPISDDYIYQELGIEKPDDYNTLKESVKQTVDDATTAPLDRIKKMIAYRDMEDQRRFFDQAPDYRALKW